MKKIITLKNNNSSILATQKYGVKRQRQKPRNQSILGAYTYGANKTEIKGITIDAKKTTKKNK